MAIMGDVQIKVDPAVLVSKAEAVSGSIGSMEQYYSELERIVSRTSYYWIGEAGDMHRNIYKEQKAQVEEMLKRMREHPADLTAIAQTYENVESQLQSLAAELPGDIIS